MEFNVKKLFIFGIIFTSIYSFVSSFFTTVTTIKNYSTFSFINFSYLVNQNLSVLGGANTWVFSIFYTVVNLSFLQYIFAYIMLPFTFLIDFSVNVMLLIVYEIQLFNYPFSILPFGFGNLISGIFYLIMIITIITGIQIVSTGLRGD